LDVADFDFIFMIAFSKKAVKAQNCRLMHLWLGSSKTLVDLAVVQSVFFLAVVATRMVKQKNALELWMENFECVHAIFHL
jgi:hypothetical protein